MNIIKHTCPFCHKEFEVAENTISALCPECKQPVNITPVQDFKEMKEQTKPINNQEGINHKDNQTNSSNTTYTPPQYQQPQNYNPNQPPQYYNPNQPPRYQQPPQYYNPNQPPQYQQPPQYYNPNQQPQYQQPPQYYNPNQPPQYQQPPQNFNPNQPPQYQQPPQYYNPNQQPQYQKPPVKEGKFEKFINDSFVPFFTSIPKKIKKVFNKEKKDKKELPPKMSTAKRALTIIVTVALIFSLVNTLFLIFAHTAFSDNSLDKVEKNLDLSDLNLIVYIEDDNIDENMSLAELSAYYLNSWGINLTEDDIEELLADDSKFINAFIIDNIKEYRDYLMGKDENASISLKEIDSFIGDNSKKIYKITKKTITTEQQLIIKNELDSMVDFDSFSSDSMEEMADTTFIRFYLSEINYIISILVSIVLLSLSFLISPVHILNHLKRNSIIAIVFGAFNVICSISLQIAADVIANLIDTTKKLTDIVINPFTSISLGIGLTLLIIGLVMLFTSIIIKKLFFVKNINIVRNKNTLENVEI